MTDLEITFHGMCTFVPESDSALWVLMSDEIMGQPDVPPHATVVRFALENLAPGTPGTGFLMLDHEHVELAGPSNGGSIQLEDFDVATDGPSSTSNLHSFGFIAPSEKACAARGLPGRGKIDRRFLAPVDRVAFADAGKLGARFFFREGSVRTELLSSFAGELLESVFVPLGVVPTSADHRQFTAATVSLRLTLHSDSITLQTTRLRTGNRGQVLTLKPSEPGAPIRLDVLNEEAETLVGFARTNFFERLGMPRPQDVIFKSVFKLCANPPALAEQPMPVPLRAVPLARGQVGGIIINGAPPCSPNRSLIA
jgi:hypothetical protein